MTFSTGLPEFRPRCFVAGETNSMLEKLIIWLLVSQAYFDHGMCRLDSKHCIALCSHWFTLLTATLPHMWGYHVWILLITWSPGVKLRPRWTFSIWRVPTSKFVLSTRIINTPLKMVHNTLRFNHGNTKGHMCKTRNGTLNFRFFNPWKNTQKNESPMKFLMKRLLKTDMD